MPCRKPSRKVAKRSSRMAGRVLLDINVILAFLSGERAASQQFMDAEVFVSSTVLGELYYSARKYAHAAANLVRIEQFAASVQFFFLNTAPPPISALFPYPPFR